MTSYVRTLAGCVALYGGALCFVFMALMVGYWLLVQPMPTIIEPPEGTYVHRGVDAQGYTAATWRAAGRDSVLWRPTPAARAEPGETLWVRRDLTFPNKTSGTITRVFVCEGGFQHTYPAMAPPTRTEGRTVKHFPLVVPLKAEGECYYEVAALFYGNPLRPEVRVEFRRVSVKVVRP